MPPSPSLMFQHTDLGPKLCALCTVGDKDAVRRLLDDADTDVNETDSTGETPLHKACHAGELEIIELLLQKDGIDISSRSNNGQTPLHIVSKLGNVKAAKLILDAEPDESRAISYVNSPDDQGLAPLCCSVEFIQMVNFLQKRYVYCEIYTCILDFFCRRILHFVSNFFNSNNPPESLPTPTHCPNHLTIYS